MLGTIQDNAQGAGAVATSGGKKGLMLFSDSRDLPGNMMMDQAVRPEMVGHSTNRIEFFAENLDANRFADPDYHNQFRDYRCHKYSEQHLERVIEFMAGEFGLVEELPSSVLSNVRVVFVAILE